jgi:AraC family transcriptional activator FtrA
MARHAKMSERTFARRFKQATGTTPHRWLQHERVRSAQALLETTSLPLERIAEQAGFSDAQLMRLHFKRKVGTTPTSYQRSFR